MPNYSLSTIYKIIPTCDHEEGHIYIGSTIRRLSERMNGHRMMYKKHLLDSSTYISSFYLFKKYGAENCKIEMIEQLSCENRNELNKKEGEYQKQLKCVNMNIAGRTQKEYFRDNRVSHAQKCHKNYIHNKEKLTLHRSEKIQCPCGIKCRRGNISTHEKKNLHKNLIIYINTLLNA